jgi:muconolactone D-isomerase
LKLLVGIEARPPGTLPEALRQDLLAAELSPIWRIPEALGNVGFWESADATELHEHLSSLPLFPCLTAEVTPLAEHPLQRLFRA